MCVSKNRATPKSPILIGFSFIFTIHFGGPPLFLGWHPYDAKSPQAMMLPIAIWQQQWKFGSWKSEEDPCVA